MGKAPKEAERTVATNFVFFIEWTTVASGQEEQRVAWRSSERKVMGAVEDYLERCADTRVDIEALVRLMEPEDDEVCLRYILKYSTRGGSNIFQLFDAGPFRGKQKALVGASRREGNPARKLAK